MSFKELGGCVRLLTYLLVALALTALVGGFFGSELVVIFNTQFHKVLDRLIMVFIVVQVILFEGAYFRQFWGGPINRAIFIEMGDGAAIASISVVLAILLGTLLGSWEFIPAKLEMKKLEQVVLAMIFVPITEEVIFRGIPLRSSVALSSKQKTGMVYITLALAALIYAAAHFVKISDSIDHSKIISIQGAWNAEGKALDGLQNFPSWRGLNLWLIGLILGCFYLKYRRLWAGFGAHAVWVFALLLLPVWLQQNEPGQDISATPWVTGPLIVLVVWELLFMNSQWNASPKYMKRFDS